MSDILSLAVMLSVARCEYLYRRFAQHSHGDGSDSDRIVGDVPFVPADLKTVFHTKGDTL